MTLIFYRQFNTYLCVYKTSHWVNKSHCNAHKSKYMEIIFHDTSGKTSDFGKKNERDNKFLTLII